jgi:hypothetical protein
MTIKLLALDLERTLIDNSLSGRPRPGLSDFLAFCFERFGRIAIFTTVEEAEARTVLTGLDRAGYLPPGLLEQVEFINWCGEYKDLSFVPDAAPTEIILIDDDATWVRPDQRGQWLSIAAWDGGPDNELRRVRAVLEGLA